MHCRYYQAQVNQKKTWFFVGVLRSFEGLVFERTIDKKQGIFEFFVPADLELYFLDLMRYFKKECVIDQLKQLPNRMVHRK